MRSCLALVLVAGCAAPLTPQSPRHVDEAMQDARLAFDRAGGEALAGRWERADRDVAALTAIFTRELASRVDPAVAPLARAFPTTELAALRRALHARDRDDARDAFARAARACNACHAAAHVETVEITVVPAVELAGR